MTSFVRKVRWGGTLVVLAAGLTLGWSVGPAAASVGPGQSGHHGKSVHDGNSNRRGSDDRGKPHHLGSSSTRGHNSSSGHSVENADHGELGANHRTTATTAIEGVTPVPTATGSPPPVPGSTATTGKTKKRPPAAAAPVATSPAPPAVPILVAVRLPASGFAVDSGGAFSARHFGVAVTATVGGRQVAAGVSAPPDLLVPPPLPPPGLYNEPMVLAAGPWQGLSLQAATSLSVPILFGVVVGLFALLQAFIDRRDPKLSSAPERGDDDSVGFM